MSIYSNNMTGDKTGTKRGQMGTKRGQPEVSPNVPEMSPKCPHSITIITHTYLTFYPLSPPTDNVATAH